VDGTIGFPAYRQAGKVLVAALNLFHPTVPSIILKVVFGINKEETARSLERRVTDEVDER
jgi:hypothetical protein